MGMFNSDDGPAPPQMEAPTKVQFEDYFDHVSGVAIKEVMGADGKKHTIRTRIQGTPEEEEQRKRGQELIIRSMKEIERLYKYDPKAVASFEPLINEFTSISNARIKDLSTLNNFGNIAEEVGKFREIRQRNIDRQMQSGEASLNEGLNRNGWANSSAALGMKAAYEAERARANDSVLVDAANFEEDLKGKRHQNNMQVYAANETGRQASEKNAMLGFELKRQNIADQEALRQNAIQENRGNLATGAALQQAEDARIAGSNVAQTAQNSFALRSAEETGRISATNQARQAEFNNQLAAKAAEGPSFVDTLLNVGGLAAGSFLGGPGGGVLATSLFGGDKKSDKKKGIV